MTDSKKIRIIWLTVITGIILSCLLALLQNVNKAGDIRPDSPIQQYFLARKMLHKMDRDTENPTGSAKIYFNNGIYPASWYRLRLRAGYFHSPHSAYTLAFMYKDGAGLPENSVIAGFWARKTMAWAIEHNNKDIYYAAENLLKEINQKR